MPSCHHGDPWHEPNTRLAAWLGLSCVVFFFAGGPHRESRKTDHLCRGDIQDELLSGGGGVGAGPGKLLRVHLQGPRGGGCLQGLLLAVWVLRRVPPPARGLHPHFLLGGVPRGLASVQGQLCARLVALQFFSHDRYALCDLARVPKRYSW